MRAESRILLSCIQQDPAEAQRREIAHLIQPGLDWRFLLALGQRHGILMLLYQYLIVFHPPNVPQEILIRLQDCYRANTHRNLLMTAELLRLLREFEIEKIPVIPLKGPALTSLLYGDLGLRPSSDLDLLFQKKDVPRAKAVLLDRGYRVNYPLPENRRAFFLNGDFEGSFHRPDGKINVEVLWGTPGDFPLQLDFGGFWKNLEGMSLEGRKILVFSPEHLLLFLSLHQATHCWARLIWLCDIARLIRKYPELQWMELLEEASRLGCLRVLLVTLNLVQTLWNESLPERIRQSIQKDAEIEALTEEILDKIFLAEDPWSSGSSGQVNFFLRATDRGRDRIGFCLRRAFMPNLNDWMAIPLSRPLFPLFYLIRPFRLAAKYGPGFFKRRLMQRPRPALGT